MIIMMSGKIFVKLNGTRKMNKTEQIAELERRNKRLLKGWTEASNEWDKCIRSKYIQTLIFYFLGIILGFMLGGALI